MKFHKSKLLTTGAAVALALAVGACSSSSDDDEMAGTPPPATTDPAPEPTPELTPAEQLTAAQAALMMAQGLVDALTSGSTADEAAAAYAALGAAQAALHAATNLPANQIAALQAQIDQLVLDLEAANSTPSTETVALEQAQADAATAATEAMEAARLAREASDAAQTAIENLATLQTGETSRGLAHAAYMQAKAAADAAAEAQTASDDAAEATDGVAATRLLVMVETARDNAVAAQGMAETQGAAAVVAAMVELKIVGTVKTVGGTDIDAGAGSTVVTVGEGNDAQTTRTGLLEGMAPETTGDGVDADDAVTGVQDDPNAEGNQAVKHVQAVADRTFPIGKVVDSADDTARLMIVTKYAGSKNAYVYNLGDAPETGTKAGYISIDDGDTTNNNEAGDDVNNVRLKSEGTFYAAGETSTGGEGDLMANDVVGSDTKAVEVFSYVDPVGTTATDNDVKKYVVLTGENENKVNGVTTYTYINVDTEVEVVANGDDTEAFETKVRAAIPEATGYKHIHFGVWAALGAAAKTGTQNLSDLGIGFVQSIGDGLSGADMPNNGDAEYSGNWAAAVQAADEDGNGPIVLKSGAASLSADFEMGEITATLTDLATLEGAIDTNTFSGTKASGISATHGLDADGKFTGSFSGGFYGAKAAEAGGIFAFTSEDAEHGAFHGAFGGDKDVRLDHLKS